MNPGKPSPSVARIRFFTWLLAGAWTACIAGSLLWNLRQQADHSLQVARRAAQITFENDVLYRRWSARQGGVYVRSSADTPPNPYLQVPDRDVTTTSGLSLTLVNPAYMARQVHALAGATGGSRGHLTSLRPLRPENAPDAWEAAALRAFERGALEVSSLEHMADGEYLRFMRPLVTEQSCLQCHAAQGYQQGEIRGGVSVSIPMASLRAIEQSLDARLAQAHFGLWLVGLAGIGVFQRSVGRQMLARDQARAGLQREVAERQRAESQLREANDRYERVLAGSEAGLWDWDVVRHTVLFSPRWKALRGLAEDEVGDAEEEWSQRIHPEDAPRVMAAVQTHFGGQTPIFAAEYRVRRKDGTWMWIADRGLAWRDAEGRVLRMAGSETDITERKQAEELLRASEQRFRQVVESLPPLLWTCRADGPCDYLSPQWLKYTGLPEAPQLGYGWLEQLHPDDRERTVAAWQATAVRGDNFAIEFRLRRHDGVYRWFRTLAVPLRDDAGQIVKWFGSNTDIQDLKEAEAALRVSRRAALNLMADAVAARQHTEQALAALRQSQEDLDRAQAVGQIGSWRLDVRRDVLTWSAENHRIFGVVQGTPLSYETFLEIVHPDDRQAVDRQWQVALRGEPYDIEHRLVVDGQVKWVREKAYLEFDGAGGLLGGFGITEDITDRKRAEEELKQTEKSLQRLNAELEGRVAERTAELARASAYNRSLIEAAVDPLVTIGLDGKITDVNAATEAATGRARKELIGTDFCDYFTQREQALAVHQQVFREGCVRDYPLEILHQAGGTTPVLYNAAVYRDERGDVIGVFAAARDITERLRAERALRAERQQLYDLLETLPVYIVLLSTDYHVPFANRFFRERFGEAHGRRCFEYLFQRAEPCENCETYKVLSTHAPGRWEWPGPDGRDYDVYDFPFVDTDGSTLILEMGIDITEGKKAQHALESSEARYRSFVTASTQLSWTTDAHGLVTEDMPSWRAFTGQTLEQIQGWGWADAVHPDDRQHTAAVWSQAVATGSLYAVEYRLRRHDGQYRWLSVRGVPVRNGGAIREWVGACTDITDQRSAEEETRRMRDELARADRVARLGELTASLAHELNQPLAAILSNAQAARRFLAADPPDLAQFREILDDIIQDDKRAGGVIHRLRLMLQKGRPEPDVFPMNDAVREVIQLLHSESVGRNAALAVDLAEGLPTVLAGRIEVQQVLVNLLLNALDAVKDVPPDRREILVRTRFEQGTIVVSVRDRGCGIPPAGIDSIFEPFFTTKSTGLGMGLAICRRMLQTHGGRIWAANTQDAGVTVSFSLPPAPASTEPSDA